MSKEKIISFAERAKEILKQYEERNDPISKRTKESQLDDLRVEQEYERVKKQLAEDRQAAKQSQAQLFADGGPFQTNGAQTADIMGNLYGYTPEQRNAILNNYGWWDKNDPNAEDAAMDNADLNDAAKMNVAKEMAMMGSNPTVNAKANTANPDDYFKPKDNLLRYAPIAGNLVTLLGLEAPSRPNARTLDANSVAGDPYLINREALRQNVNRAYNGAKGRLFDSSNGSFSNVAKALAGMNEGQARALNEAYGKADVMDNAERARVQGIRNNILSQNAEKEWRADEAYRMDKGNYEGTRAAYIQSLAANVGNIGEEQLNRTNAKDFAQYMKEMGLSQNMIDKIMLMAEKKAAAEKVGNTPSYKSTKSKSKSKSKK
jgi:hypothetical protein